jgi:hypothetical protein
MVWYVVEGLTVMTWLCELDPGANVAPACEVSSWLWLVVVSVTETAGPDAACAALGLITAIPATSATAPNDAVIVLMRDMVLLQNLTDFPGPPANDETKCNTLERFRYDDVSSLE